MCSSDLSATTGASGTATAEAARATVVATRAIAARATRSTAATVIATRTIAAGTTGATPATRATPTAAIATAEIARRRGELPADTGARHLTTPRTVITLGLRLGLRIVELQAAEATRLRRAALSAEPTATTAAATTAAAIATTAATITTTAVVATIVAAALRAGDAIDHVVKLAAGDRAVRALLALEHADQADLIDAITDDVERLDQALRAIGLDADGLGDRLDDRIVLGGRRRRGAFGLHRLGLARFARIGTACIGTLGDRLRVRAAFDGRRIVLRRLRRRFATVAERGLGDRRSRRNRRRIRLVSSTGSGPSGRGLAKG